MLSDKKRSSHRLSSLFKSSDTDAGSTASSDSGSRLSRVKNRVSSVTHLAPDYPPPPAPQHGAQLPPTIQPVESAPVALPPPPPISTRSRSASPARLVRNSRPGTPNADSAVNLLAPGNDSKLKKLKRKSGLFGGGNNSSDDERGNQATNGPPAWIVGHQGKYPYNLAPLLHGEKVGLGR
jgi:hypothetical protein